MSIEADDKLKWINLWDSPSGVWGLAYVKHGFNAQLHSHNEEEIYYFLYGEGEFALGNKKINIIAPNKMTIPGGVEHAMTPVSNFVILLYYFPNPNKNFDDIEYTFLDKYVPVPTRPSKSILYNCPISEEQKALVRTSKL